MMGKMTPEIRDQLLFCYPDPSPVCPVGSPAWFAWLETASAFRYCSGQRRNLCRGHGPLYGPVSFRKERRRRVGLWYAYRRVHGVLHKRYVGKSAGLTLARLEETAVLLNEVW
jgi:LuxR family transcriptional regulator, maltose regulon positive regulatory protein